MNARVLSVECVSKYVENLVRLLVYGLIVLFVARAGYAAIVDAPGPGQQVEISGVIRCEFFPGPPGYGEDPAQDIPEVVCFVYPRDPVLLHSLRPDRRGAGESPSRLSRFQLVIDQPDVWRQVPSGNLARLSQQFVRIVGTVELPSTAHHREILLVVRWLEVRKAERR